MDRFYVSLYICNLLDGLLCSHNVGINSFGLHEQISCESEGVLSELLCIHNVGMETFVPHELILCVYEG